MKGGFRRSKPRKVELTSKHLVVPSKTPRPGIAATKSYSLTKGKSGKSSSSHHKQLKLSDSSLDQSPGLEGDISLTSDPTSFTPSRFPKTGYASNKQGLGKRHPCELDQQNSEFVELGPCYQG